MFSALEEKIEQGAIKGLNFLEISVKDPIRLGDAILLLREGLSESFYAILVYKVRETARKNGKMLPLDASYSAIQEMLKGEESTDKLIRDIHHYFLCVYRLSSPEERQNLRDSLFMDLVRNVPYAGDLVIRVIDFDNRNIAHQYKK